MSPLWLALLLILVAVLLAWHRFRRKLQSAQQAQEERTAKAAAAGQVLCVSCGLQIDKAQALEKKGRYFCGLKPTERSALD